MPRGRPARNPVEQLRSRAWALAVCRSAGIPERGYQMEKCFEPHSIRAKNDGTRVRSCKWDRILKGKRSPSEQTRELAYARIRHAEQLEAFHQHPIWGALACGDQTPKHWQQLYNQMPEPIIKHLYANPEAPPEHRIRVVVTEKKAEPIIRIGGLDALACILCLLRDGGIRPPTILYQSLEISFFNLLIWELLESYLTPLRREIYNYVLNHIVVLQRKRFCRKHLWGNVDEFESRRSNWGRLMLRAEDLYLINNKKERFEFFYWYLKGDEGTIISELNDAIDVGKYYPANSLRGLKWLIKQLNRTRTKENRIGNYI